MDRRIEKIVRKDQIRDKEEVPFIPCFYTFPVVI